MARTATARARLDPKVKEKAEKILEECGLTASQGINLFYRQVIARRGLPFPIRHPNALTKKTLRDSDAGRGVTRFEDEDEFFTDLGF